MGLTPGWGEMVAEVFQEAFDGEADDVAHGTFEMFNEAALIFLRGVGAGFVQGVHAGEVGVEVDFVDGAEFHAGRFDEADHFFAGAVDEADAGEDFVYAAAEGFQHGTRFGEVGGFAECLVVEGDDGVRAEHQAVRKAGGDFQGFALRVDQAEFPRGERGVREFFDVGGTDLKWNTGLGEQFAAPG